MEGATITIFTVWNSEAKALSQQTGAQVDSLVSSNMFRQGLGLYQWWLLLIVDVLHTIEMLWLFAMEVVVKNCMMDAADDGAQLVCSPSCAHLWLGFSSANSEHPLLGFLY